MDIIEQNFRTTESQSRTYDELLAVYLEKLNQGGKAPKQYLPEIVLENEKTELREMLFNAIYHVEHHQKLTESNLKNM